jgi:hypothetical protein
MSGEDQRQPPFGSPIDQARFAATLNAEAEALRASPGCRQPGFAQASTSQGTNQNTPRSEPVPRRSVLYRVRDVESPRRYRSASPGPTVVSTAESTASAGLLTRSRSAGTTFYAIPSFPRIVFGGAVCERARKLTVSVPGYSAEST